MANKSRRLKIRKSVLLSVVSSLLWCGACGAMNAEVVRHVDLHNLGGHAIVPRPYDIPAPMDLGEEDLLLQNVLQKAVYQVSSAYFSTHRALDVNVVLPLGWNRVDQNHFNGVRQAVAEASVISKRLYDLYQASVNHNVGASVAANLFAHIIKQRHIWHRRATAGDSNLHYASWITALRVMAAANIPDSHSSFLINEDEDALSFFKRIIMGMEKAVSSNVANLRITDDQNAIYIDICMGSDFLMDFVCCDPSTIAAAIPLDQQQGVQGLNRLRALIPAVGNGQQLNFQQKADAIRDIADCVGQNNLPPNAFPVLNNGQVASITAPQQTNKVRIIINRQAAPYISSMFPLPR